MAVDCPLYSKLTDCPLYVMSTNSPLKHTVDTIPKGSGVSNIDGLNDWYCVPAVLSTICIIADVSVIVGFSEL